MPRPTLKGLIFAEAKEPWVLLIGALGGGVAWAVGLPTPVAALTALAMIVGSATYAVLSGNTRSAEASGEKTNKKSATTETNPHTRQGQLLGILDGYLGDMQKLQTSTKAASAQSSVAEALGAVVESQDVAIKLAAAIDGLDWAIANAQQSHGRWAGSQSRQGIAQAEQRMKQRRAEMIGLLDSTVGEVAEVYTKLLELAAVTDSYLATDEADTMGEVNSSIDLLREAVDSMREQAQAEPA